MDKFSPPGKLDGDGGERNRRTDDNRRGGTVPEKKSAKKTRQPKERSQPRKPDGIRALAAELREVADRLEGYAVSMETLGIPSIKPLTGNFHQALEKIRVFTTQQVLARLMVEAEKRGKGAHVVFGRQ